MIREPEAVVKAMFSKYLSTGNLESFVTDLNAHYKHKKGLKGYI